MASSTGIHSATPNSQQNKKNNYNELQRHAEFFDRNKDGVIYPWESFHGFRAIGFNFIASFILASLINIALSYSTLDSWIPNLLFPIYIQNIRRARHGSDTGVYDEDGHFNGSQFEAIFTKFAKTYTNRISYHELQSMTQYIKNAHDLFGRFAAKLEWAITYILLKDNEGFVSKDEVKGVYDGSIFYQKEKEVMDKSRNFQ